MVSIRENNREKYNLPTVFSILIYTHPETGFPLAIVDGSYHTVMRTGSAAAVSAKWMSRKDTRKLAIVGAGHMAKARSRPATRSSPGTRFASEPQQGYGRPFRQGAAAQIRELRDQALNQP